MAGHPGSSVFRPDHRKLPEEQSHWIPAFAGMTTENFM
jgi:hypothetical protein